MTTESDDNVVVALLRCELSDTTVKLFQQQYAGKQIEFIPIQPTNAEETDQIIEKWHADVTLLTPEPLPALALKRGKRFVFVGPDGQLHELLGMNPITRPFTP